MDLAFGSQGCQASCQMELHPPRSQELAMGGFPKIGGVPFCRCLEGGLYYFGVFYEGYPLFWGILRVSPLCLGITISPPPPPPLKEANNLMSATGFGNPFCDEQALNPIPLKPLKPLKPLNTPPKTPEP